MKTISKGKVTKIALLSVLVVLLSVCVSIFAYRITPVKAEAAENTEEPQITLVGANVSLKDSVNIVYAAAVKGYDYTKYKTKLIVWKTPQEDYTIENALKIIEKNKDKTDKSEIECVIVDSSYHATLGSYSCDMFYYGMPAKNIVDQLYVRAYVEIDGKEYYSGTTKYSLLEYLYDQLSKSGLTEYQKRMYEIILKYGGRAQDLFDYLRNRRADDTFYSIHVENGTFADGFTRGMFLEGEEVVMKANAAPEGKKFAYWQDKNGIILGYDEVLTVKATSANTYTAIFVNKITVAEQLHLKASVAYDDDISAANLPDVINIKDDAGNITSSIKVAWDKTQFVKGQIGEQVLTATPADEESKALLGGDTVTMTVTVLPYTFEVDTITGNYHITKYYGSEAKVSIPEEYRGKPIDTINALAFNAALSMTELYIPDTITKIEKNAFNACNNIETIRIPFIGDSLSTKNIFGYIFGTDSYEMQKSFVPVNLHKVIISDQVKTIQPRAFYGCKQITKVELPDKLGSIGGEFGYYTFAYTGITDITLPETINNLGACTFEGTNIRRVDICDLNAFLKCTSCSSFGGEADLYVNGKLVTEIKVPSGIVRLSGVLSGIKSLKKVIIPDTVIYLNSSGHITGAFANCKNLEEVIFEGNPQVEEMCSTFEDCVSLKSIHIPASVVNYRGAFSNCVLQDVYYDGSFEKWCKIGSMPTTERFYYKKEDGYEELIDAVIPETITQVNSGVLQGYKALRSVTLHEGVTAIANAAFSNCENLSSIVLPSQLRFIGGYAFGGCKSLYSINIPKYISEIGERAFEYCYNLAEVYNCSDYIKDMTIGSDSYGCVAKYAKVIHTDMNETSNIVYDGDYAMFKDGNEYILLGYFGDMSSLVLPDRATSINPYAFYRNKNISSIVIGYNTTIVGGYAFYNCENLYSVTLPMQLKEIKDYAFDCKNLVEIFNKSDLNIEPGSSLNGRIGYYAQRILDEDGSIGEIFSIGEFSFYKYDDEYVLYRYTGESSVSSLTLPGLVDGGHTYKIGKMVFDGKKITDLIIPGSVTEILPGAFKGWKNIEHVIISEGLTTIGEGAFENCSITSIQIPESLIKIGEKAFMHSSLQSVVIPSGVIEIEDSAFFQCWSLTKVTIGNGVEVIGYQAFWGCNKLTEVNIPSSVITIGARAFYYCSSLTSVVIGENVTTIGDSAFYDCSSLTNVVIGKSVSRIEKYAFNSCSKLTSAEFKNTYGWVCKSYSAYDIDAEDLQDCSIAAKYLKSTYYSYTWTREDKGE